MRAAEAAAAAIQQAQAALAALVVVALAALAAALGEMLARLERRILAEAAAALAQAVLLLPFQVAAVQV